MPDLLALSFNPFSGTVRAFGRPFLERIAGLLCPLLTSALRSGHPQSRRTRCRSRGVSPTAFISHPPIYDLAIDGYELRDTLPSDGPSRSCPCALLVLHLHQVVQGTSTLKLSDISDTQDACAPPAPVPPHSRRHP